MDALPRHVETLIVGGGTTGSALAGLLAERTAESVLVLEGGPDFGSYADNGWPPDVLDATWLAESHQLGYASDDGYRGRRIEFQRAGMIGGCSSHNGCAAIWGSRLDYDGLAAAGFEGWSRAEVEPLLRAAGERMRVRIPAEAELAPFHRPRWRRSSRSARPRVHDLNDLDADTGVAPSPANIVDGVRWNAALAYLDPVRGRPLAAHLRPRARRAPARRRRAGARRRRAARGRARRPSQAERVIVCAGAYDSPALLLRSGIGPARGPAGARHPRRRRPARAWARTSTTTPPSSSRSSGTPELRRACEEYAASGAFAPVEGVIAKLRSGQCAPEGFDLHVYPVGGSCATALEFWIPVACMTPRSRGSVRMRERGRDACRR